MHLVQILLPLRTPHGNTFPHAEFARVASELTDQFGGMTAYTRAPASGLWQEEKTGRTERDDIVVYEVMVDDLDARWWADYRRILEMRFVRHELVVRAQEMRRL
jgi:crotonobetainyl-CoA:carnitine CoA-transferase CaiB-like acyl-CoA transferase